MTIQAQELIAQALLAQKSRTFYAAWPENPKEYGEDAAAAGLDAFQKKLSLDQ
jgi:hypothetical protein